MKIVSAVFFLGALIGTWCLAHSKSGVPQSVHVGIQNDLKNIITEYVQKNLPESKNLRFDKFWTENLKKNKVKAFFVYSFEDSASQNGAVVEISGSAILNKVDENSETVTYSLDQLQILDNKIDFQEPIQITAGAHELETPSPAAPENQGK